MENPKYYIFNIKARSYPTDTKKWNRKCEHTHVLNNLNLFQKTFRCTYAHTSTPQTEMVSVVNFSQMLKQERAPDPRNSPSGIRGGEKICQLDSWDQKSSDIKDITRKENYRLLSLINRVANFLMKNISNLSPGI